jgi:hypothetical protein
MKDGRARRVHLIASDLNMSAQNPSAAVAPSAAAQHRSGLIAAISAFAFWGVFPLYLNLLAAVPALQILAHRIVWCCAFVIAWLRCAASSARYARRSQIPARDCAWPHRGR